MDGWIRLKPKFNHAVPAGIFMNTNAIHYIPKVPIVMEYKYVQCIEVLGNIVFSFRLVPTCNDGALQEDLAGIKHRFITYTSC
jgi:hypothetical protein